MKIDLRTISSTGCVIDGMLAQEDFNVRSAEIECLAPVKLSGHLEKSAGMARATVEARTTFRYVCGRCLESCDKDFCEHFEFHYPLDAQEHVVDVAEDVRQEILLGFPGRVICQEQCKGLCLGCGVNLNHEKCQCKGIKTE